MTTTQQATLTTPGGMVLVPAGTYTVGSPLDEPGRFKDEPGPQEVKIASFAIDPVPVTVGLWRDVMGTLPAFADASRDDLPVTEVSWYDAVRFCNERSRLMGFEPAYEIKGEDAEPHVSLGGGNGYRLPTEIEWEVACRAGTTGPRYGNLDEIAWHVGNSGGRLHPVAQKKPNAWGLYDTLGNVWEWCWDVFCPPTPARSDRVVRGGCWYYVVARFLRASVRYWFGPGSRYVDLGLRCARSDRVNRGGGWLNGGIWDLRASGRGPDAPSNRNCDLGFRCARSLSGGFGVEDVCEPTKLHDVPSVGISARPPIDVGIANPADELDPLCEDVESPMLRRGSR